MRIRQRLELGEQSIERGAVGVMSVEPHGFDIESLANIPEGIATQQDKVGNFSGCNFAEVGSPAEMGCSTRRGGAGATAGGSRTALACWVMNGWHESWDDQPGARAVICGHLHTIAVRLRWPIRRMPARNV